MGFHLSSKILEKRLRLLVTSFCKEKLKIIFFSPPGRARELKFIRLYLKVVFEKKSPLTVTFHSTIIILLANFYQVSATYSQNLNSNELKSPFRQYGGYKIKNIFGGFLSYNRTCHRYHGYHSTKRTF